MIHSFDIGGGGISPEGDLIQANDGFLYGITASGPVPGGGIGGVFRIAQMATSLPSKALIKLRRA